MPVNYTGRVDIHTCSSPPLSVSSQEQQCIITFWYDITFQPDFLCYMCLPLTPCHAHCAVLWATGRTYWQQCADWRAKGCLDRRKR